MPAKAVLPINKLPHRPGLFWPTFFTAAALLILIALGTWQVERLQWKQGLLDRIAERVHAPPVPIELALVQATPSAGQVPADVEYTHVRLKGRFRHDLERYVYATGKGDWGWDVFTPLEMYMAQPILINRGYVPQSARDPAVRKAGQPEGDVEITGLIRVTPPAKPWFIPNSEPTILNWYWPEIVSITQSAYPDAPNRPVQFYIDADATNLAAPPHGGTTNLNLPNRHLEYAITWFALAVTLCVIYGLFVFRRLRSGRG